MSPTVLSSSSNQTLPPKDGSSPRSIARILGLFDAIARAPEGLSLAQLGAILQSPKSSLLTILRPLVADDFLIHTKGRYLPGPKIFALAATILSSRKFTNLLRIFVDELVERSGETAILATLDQDVCRATYVMVVESPQSIRYAVPAGVTRPLYVSAAGQVLLAYQTREWQDNYLKAEKLKALTPATVTDPTELRQRLDAIRRDGVATSIGEAVPGSTGIAAPVFSSGGEVVAAILVAAPQDRASHHIEKWKELVKEIAARASLALGHLPNLAKAAVQLATADNFLENSPDASREKKQRPRAPRAQ